MYPDSPLAIRFIVRIYVFITGLSVLIFRRSLWPVHVPSYLLVKPAGLTTKQDYKFEHWHYRNAHSLAMNEGELNKWNYYLYSSTAKKYNWPYIKEVYDNSTD